MEHVMLRISTFTIFIESLTYL